MKNLYIHCDGGFGNRFNSLVIGLLVSKIGKFNPIISWPSTNVCRATFDEIFENDYILTSNRLEYYSNDLNNYEFVMHENQLLWNTRITSPYNFNKVNDLISFFQNSSKENLFYFNNLIPNYADFDLNIIRDLKFKSLYYEIVDNFLEHKNYIGVHLRSTDFPQSDANFNTIYSQIKSSDKKYFVCSDNPEVENKFNELENVFIYPKTDYVEKINSSKEWRVLKGEIKDEMNKSLSFNVERSSDSVKQAIIDLLILSRSDIMITSNSTFLNTALLLKMFNNQKTI